MTSPHTVSQKYLDLKLDDHPLCATDPGSVADQQRTSDAEVQPPSQPRRTESKRPVTTPATPERRRNPSFEPEFDGDLEQQSWIQQHIFDDRCGY